MSHAAATRALLKKLPGRVLTDPKACFLSTFDSSKLSFAVDAVIRPRSREDVATVLELANKHKVPVTTRGRGTSLTGSASPVQGGWVLDLSRWRRIKIDPEAGFAHVQAGARVADIQRAAAALGWFYPPDPSSREHCTIGGTIACNAGGMHGGKYGVTRDFVVALDGFLPTGEPVALGRAVRKYAAGYNLRDLWVGSEGALGVITGAVLRLVPLPAARWTFLASFADEAAAFRYARALFGKRVQPAICEFLDRLSVGCAESANRAEVFPGRPGRPVILLELAGHPAEVAEQSGIVRALAEELGAVYQETEDRAEAERLWKIRRTCSSAMFELGDAKLNEDIVVPLANYERFNRFLERLRKRSGLFIPTFGHLADGNLHVNIMYHRADPDESAAAVRAVDELMTGVVKLGGAISGEHGIGLAKTPFIRVEHGEGELRAMRAIKEALDPNNILNPGKLFDVFKVWEHPRVQVKLPWDHK